MALWEYKTITSGIHGFATPALLETFLNNLGKDEWEIVSYQPSPTNPLAFNGLVRRTTQRDWVPPEIAAATPAPKPAATSDTPAAPDKPAAPASETGDDEKHSPADSDNPQSAIQNPQSAAAAALRPVRDTERDQDPDAPDADDDTDDWDSLDIDEDLPTFFDALKPHYRANQRGPGKSVAIDFLVKRWELPESDILAALKECGLALPETEDAEPQYFEFEDDLYWVNRTNRGQYFINTREKPRPRFRIAAAKPLSPDDPACAELAAERAAELARLEARKQKAGVRSQESGARSQEPEAETEGRATAPASSPAPAETQGTEPETTNTTSFGTAPIATPALKADLTDATRALLERIRPLMRRNRHGPGYSGSINFLAHALKIADDELSDQVTEALGVPLPETNGIKPTFVEIENSLYWLNKDSRGNIWINGRELKHRKPEINAPVGASLATPATIPVTPSKQGVVSDAPTPADPAKPPTTNLLPLTTDNAPATAASTVAAPAAIASATTASATLATTAPAAATSTAAASATAASAAPEPQPTAPIDASASSSPLTAVRLLLRPNKRGTGVSGETGYLARTLGKPEAEFIATLTAAGLVVPPDADTKPTFVAHAGEIFWFGLFEKDGETSIWLNAKVAKKKPGRPRTRKPKAPEAGETSAEE